MSRFSSITVTAETMAVGNGGHGLQLGVAIGLAMTICNAKNAANAANIVIRCRGTIDHGEMVKVALAMKNKRQEFYFSGVRFRCGFRFGRTPKVVEVVLYEPG